MSLRLIHTHEVMVGMLPIRANVQRDSEWGEYRVTIKAGYATIATYHTDDKRDALSSASVMLNQEVSNHFRPVDVSM